MSLLDLFKKKPKSYCFEKLTKIDLSKVKVGQIYEFRDGYHTKKPYYAEVIDVQRDSFTTSIPDLHETKIDSNNWGYHKKRMFVVGMKKDFGHLLLNQTGLVTHNKK